MYRTLILFPALFMGMATLTVNAQDSFGSGANSFSIDFVTVGNAGNANDAGAGGGSFHTPYGGVGYTYRISTYAISQRDIANAAASGLANVTAGAHTGLKPAADISWYEAAAFVNWMNTSKGHQAAYDLTFDSEWSMNTWSAGDQATTGVNGGTNPYRHKDAIYVLPSEDEWYKAAYHQNDGVTANYWDYASGGNTIPTPVSSGTVSGTAVYDQTFLTGPADITLAGGLGPYGTVGQNGNVWEWNESASDGVNDMATEIRVIRGGAWDNTGAVLSSSTGRGFNTPSTEFLNIGFRVASIPEPSSILMLLLGGWMLMYLRHRRFSR